MSIESLKAQARRHEQSEEWQKALDQYGKAIAALDQDEQADIGLYNRVGDLYIRVGNYDEALQHYEKAVELYREAYLHNNAIAVCKKIVRHVPARTRVYLTMGQIRAEQGFVPDARTNFLTYAERMQEEGDMDESFRALVEFCDLVPDDTDGRILVADQMVANDRKDDALAQYAIAYRQLKEKGQDDRAFGLERKLLELEPDTDFDALAAEVESGSDEGFDWSGEPTGHASFGEEAAAVEEAGFADGSEHDDAGEDFGSTAMGLRDADALVDEDALIGADGFGDEDGAEGDAPADGGAAPSFEEAAEALVSSARQEADVQEAGAQEGEGQQGELQDDAEDEGFELPLVEGTAEFEEEDEGFELPLISYEDDEEDEDEAMAGEDVGEEVGALDEGEPLPLLTGTGSAEPAGSGEHIEEAVEDERLGSRAVATEAEPDTTAGESATSEDEPVTTEGESATEAEADEPEAQADAAEPSPGPPEAPAAAPPEESQQYVDLGSMIFGDEPQEPKTTRFRVAYQEPTGDEAADFQKMLSQFKEKVSENLDASDVRSHYDLGTAYKEMGLLDEAISEFQSALRAAPGHLPTFELMGQTFMEMGKPEAAAKSLERALTVRAGVEDDMVGIYYHLARAYEQLERKAQAIEFYDRVFSLDINFADVTDRLRDLR